MSQLPIQQGGLRVLSGIVPSSSASTYGTHYSYLGVGGYVEVPNIDYRNSIPSDSNMNDEGYSTGRRRYGMIAYVINEDKLYRLFPYSGGSIVSLQTFTGASELNQVTMLSGNNGWVEVLSSSVSITGGTYFSGSSSIVLYNSTGGTISISGITQITGATYNQNTTNLTLSKTDNTNIVASGVTGVYISGGTFVSNTNTLQLNNSTGGTVSITGITVTATNVVNPGDGRVLVSTGNSENVLVAQSNMVFNGTNLNITGGTFVTDSGGSLDSSAIVQLKSTTKGFLPPVMTTVQKNAIINPTSGLTVYDSTIEDLSVYTSSGWTGVITERDTLQIVTNRGNTTTNSIEYVGSEEAIRPSVDSVGTLGALNFQFGTVYSRAISSANNNLDITGSNVNLNDSLGNIKLRVFGSTGNVTIQNGGTHTDEGFRLDVNGTTRFQGSSTFTGSTTASTAVARGVLMRNTLVATANGDTLVGLDINPTFNVGSFTGTTNIATRIQGILNVNSDINFGGNIVPTGSTNDIGTISVRVRNIWSSGILANAGIFTGYIQAGSNDLLFNDANGIEGFRLKNTTRNVLIGTTTDSGFRLDVNGTTRFQNASTFTGSITASAAIARGVYMNQTLVAAADNDTLVGLDINPTYTRSSFTGVTASTVTITSRDIVLDNTTTSGLIINASQTTGGGSGGAIKYGLQIVGSGNFNRNIGTEVYGLNIPSYSGSVYGDREIGAYIQDRVAIGTYNPISAGSTTSPLLTIGNAVDYSAYTSNPNSIYLRFASTTAGITSGIYGGQSINQIQAGIFFTKGTSNGQGFIDFITSNTNATGTLNARMFGNGNLLIQSGGTFTDAGFRLDVSGNTRIQGTTTFLNNLTIGNGTLTYSNNPNLGFTITGGQSLILSHSNGNNGSVTLGSTTSGNFTVFLTNQTVNGVAISRPATIVSGTTGVQFNSLLINNVINFSAATTTIARGLYINPTLTSVPDFRAIETTAGRVIISGSVTSISAVTQGVLISNTLVASANDTTLVGLDIFPTFTNGAFTGVTNISLKVEGGGVTSTTTGLLIQNSANTETFLVRDDAGVRIGSGSFGHPSTTRFQVNTLAGAQVLRLDPTQLYIPDSLLNLTANAITIQGGVGVILNHGNGNTGLITLGSSTTGGNFTVTTSNTTRNGVTISRPVTPISGTTNFQFNSLLINNVINFTGATTSIARGLFISPTLTSVPDFRAIETTVGNVIFGSTSGNVLIGSGATDIGVLLNVSGSGRFNSINVNTLSLNSATGNPIGAITGSFAGGSLSFYPIDQFANTWFNHTGTGNILFDNASNDHVFRTNFTEAFIIKNNRNILIGTTTDAGYKLDVNGTARVQNSLTLGNLSGDPSGANGMIYYNTTTNKFRGYENGSWTNLI